MFQFFPVSMGGCPSCSLHLSAVPTLPSPRHILETVLRLLSFSHGGDSVELYRKQLLDQLTGNEPQPCSEPSGPKCDLIVTSVPSWKNLAVMFQDLKGKRREFSDLAPKLRRLLSFLAKLPECWAHPCYSSGFGRC